MLDREINQQSTKLPPYFVFCFGITYDCVKRVQASNNTLLDKPVNGVACPSNVESEAPNMRIDIQKRNMQHCTLTVPLTVGPQLVSNYQTSADSS